MSSTEVSVDILRPLLLNWYKVHGRKLPWRQNQDPYLIWLSEVMLQQTTVTAVIPYFDRFSAKFPTLNDLALAPLTKVLELWAGLGYYSRAKNLHKASHRISKMKAFPQTYSQLLKLPGFGPYTARAVSSIAFGEAVGVVDGNVIRILSRVFGKRIKHWITDGKILLQKLSDEFSFKGNSANINQALMDLGAQICTRTSPRCRACPWVAKCLAFKNDLINILPLKKPKREIEIWQWRAQVVMRNKKIALIKNSYAPFLKNEWILPGTVKKCKKRPKAFAFKHAITHHAIYGNSQKNSGLGQRQGVRWVTRKELSQIAPFSILQKALNHLELK
ncbi:MAG: A/G-specific adenine glycosylase [Pseudomonadota bacterium]|nr:A/G-specific adenine glycosylase [Pseudomonadota bacterium]